MCSRHKIHTQTINPPGPVMVTTQEKSQKGFVFLLARTFRKQVNMTKKCHKLTTDQPMAPPGRGTEQQQPSGNNKKIKSKATSYLLLPQRGNCKTRKEIHLPMHTRSSDPYVSSLLEQSVPHRYPCGISVTNAR